MSAGNQNRVSYFTMLSEAEQRAAIRRLSRSGMVDHAIASITTLSVEMVRRILAEPDAPT
jgi:ABC-type phosphate/phosphonate transport system ATPase subunit